MSSISTSITATAATENCDDNGGDATIFGHFMAYCRIQCFKNNSFRN